VSSHILLCAARRGLRICAPAIPLFALSLISHPAPAAAQTVALPPVQVDVPRRPRRNTRTTVPTPTPAEEQSGEVVTSPTTVATPTVEVANSITVITADDIARKQLRTLPDALQEAPGLNVVQSGGVGAQTSIFIRGTNANHVKVLIDGIDVTDPVNPNQAFDFSQLPTEDIARIEVLRGPQSGLYGSDAIGGVISITTKRGEGPPKAYLSLEGGSFGTFNQSTGVRGSQDRFNYSFNVMHIHAASTPVTPLEILAPGQARNNDYYDNKTFSTRLGYDFSDSFSINAVSRYTASTHDLTGDFDDNFHGPDIAKSTQLDHQSYSRIEAVWSLLDGRFKNFFGAAYTKVQTKTFFPEDINFNGVAAGSGPSNAIGTRTKLDWRGVFAINPDHTVVMGLEDEMFAFDQFSPFGGGVPSASNANRGAYVELQSKFWERLFLVANVRRDDNDQFGGHQTFRIAPAFIVPWTETKLKASYGTGFKAPTLSQLYNSFPLFFFANPNLLPEQSKGYDIGFEQPLMHDRIRFGVTYFHNDITDLIQSVDIPGQFVFGVPVQTLGNVGQATTYGAETFAAVAVTPRLNLRADYTYTVAQDDILHVELLRRPKNKASLSANWQATDQLKLTSTFLYVGSWLDISRDNLTPNVAPPYHVVNLAANYAASEHVTYFGRIDNLFNEHYQVPIGFLRPGIGVFGGVRLTN
jgi:vitamin B12 transporter